MKTFAEARDFVDNPLFTQLRTRALQSLDLSLIDAPVKDIVTDFAKLTCCYPFNSAVHIGFGIGRSIPLLFKSNRHNSCSRTMQEWNISKPWSFRRSETIFSTL